jgi:type VI secretion system protein ImpK
MTPRFARAVDPIFKYVLDLLDAIHRGEKPPAHEERLAIRGLLEHAEAILGRRREWDLARYAIVSWIDEMLVEVAWPGAEWWSNNVLEMELFNSRLCFEEFYLKAKEASTLPQRDALEVFYLCMMLGFRGLYREPEIAQSFIESHSLPPDMEAWARQVSLSIRVGQGRPELAPPKRDLGNAAPLTQRSFPVWCWVSAVIALLGTLFWFLASNPGVADYASVLGI